MASMTAWGGPSSNAIVVDVIDTWSRLNIRGRGGHALAARDGHALVPEGGHAVQPCVG